MTAASAAQKQQGERIMGLFSNNKKLCPICGSPTPRLLATVVDDQPLCKA